MPQVFGGTSKDRAMSSSSVHFRARSRELKLLKLRFPQRRVCQISNRCACDTITPTVDEFPRVLPVQSTLSNGFILTCNTSQFGRRSQTSKRYISLHATMCRPPPQGRFQSLDARIGLATFKWHQRSSPLFRAMIIACSLAGDEIVHFPLPLAFGLGFVLTGKNENIPIVAEIFGDIGMLCFVEMVAKSWSRRDRPSYAKQSSYYVLPGEQYSWPSGHTMRAFYLATCVVWSPYWNSSAAGNLGREVSAFALAAGTGLSRVAKGRHYPSDVLCGALIGVSLGLTACLLGPTNWAVLKYPCGVFMTLAAIFFVVMPRTRTSGFLLHVIYAGLWCASTKIGLGPWSTLLSS